jgi:hypothetical protein
MPLALIQSTVTPPEPRDDPADVPAEASEPNEPAAGPRPRSRSKRKPAAGEKCSAHKLSLPDSVFTRLELTAIKRGSTASAIAAEILDRNLPRLRIAADD